MSRLLCAGKIIVKLTLGGGQLMEGRKVHSQEKETQSL